MQCKLDVWTNIANDNQLCDIASCTAHAMLAAATVSGEEGQLAVLGMSQRQLQAQTETHSDDEEIDGN